jgi:chromosome segregation ATPase
LLRHVDSLERQVAHVREERDRLSEQQRQSAAQHSREATQLRALLSAAREEVQRAAQALTEQKTALHSTSVQLSVAQDEVKRLRHQCEALESSTAQRVQQARLSCAGMVVDARSASAEHKERESASGGRSRSLIRSDDDADNDNNVHDYNEDRPPLESNTRSPARFIAGGNASGAISPIRNSVSSGTRTIHVSHTTF